MGHEQNENHERQHQSNRSISGLGQTLSNSLESASSYVGRSTSASAAGDDGGKSFTVAFRALLEWSEARGLIHPENHYPFLGRPPDGFGDEHQAWFDEVSNRWFKATYPNRFGLGWGRVGTATAAEYLSRLVLQNRCFGDDIRLVAVLNSAGRIRVLTSQPHISGEAASASEIQQWFQEIGFRRRVAEGRIAWYLRERNLLIADAHEGNVLKTPEGALVPIDLNIIQPEGDLLAWANKWDAD